MSQIYHNKKQKILQINKKVKMGSNLVILFSIESHLLEL